MQLMSWTIARLGSRFTLTFEPYRRRVLHSAMGRFLDQPLDLAVGMIEPDGTRRVLPLTQDDDPGVVDLAHCEQFERFNSITFRGYSEKYRVRFEFNIHSVFYPQDERLCIMPAFYLEMRVHPVDRFRWTRAKGSTPDKVKLFLRLRRPDTRIIAGGGGSGGDGRGEGENSPGRLDLHYRNSLTPYIDDGPAHAIGGGHPTGEEQAQARGVDVAEQIVSLNANCVCAGDGELQCELPITDTGSGIKWRLVWAAHVADPVLEVKHEGEIYDATFRYNRYWPDVDGVLKEAVAQRDTRLAYSRRFEKAVEQAPLETAQSHLLAQSFQAYAANTFWADVHISEDDAALEPVEWFSAWEGSCLFHGTLDVEYNIALLYLSLWPRLLRLQLDAWAQRTHDHDPSGGAYLDHDLGVRTDATAGAYPHPMPVEENANYLLLLQAYARWTGDTKPARDHLGLIRKLADYLVWTDRDGSGFPSEGVANTIDDANPATQFARKQTYLAVKRVAALQGAADLMRLTQRRDGDEQILEFARELENQVKDDTAKIEQAAWLGDHYAVCVDRSAVGVIDAWTGQPLAQDRVAEWDAYSIYTANGLLLPMMVGQPPLLDQSRLRKDIASGIRENFARYGCGHTSAEPENIWISQNLWRDHIAGYLKLERLTAQPYWDLQVVSNTAGQSLGYTDTYINNNLIFYPRGITAIGFLLAGPRLVIDRLAPTGQNAEGASGKGGTYITVDPDRRYAQRWPLLALADWRAGKIPVCVVDDQGRVSIECQTDPVIIQGESATEAVSGASMIG